MRIDESRIRQIIREEAERALQETRDHEDEQTRGVTITVGGKRKDGTYPWKKEVAGQPVKKGKAKSEAAAWRAAIDA